MSPRSRPSAAPPADAPPSQGTGAAGDDHPVDLLDLPHDELEALVASLGEPRFRADQIFRWIHGRGATRFEEMTDLSRSLRARLAEASRIGALALLDVRDSEDGSAKLALQTADGHVVEAVLMPEARKVSVCLSSQVGCAQGCGFCATARLGLRRSLRAGEIVAQLYAVRRYLAERGDERRISNVVYMGMGEPLANLWGTTRSIRLLTHPLGANLSSRRITVSTVGILPALERLGAHRPQVNLAISLNATDQETRARIMPAARRYPLDALLEAIRRFPLEKRRRVTWEYVLLKGLNDREEDARRLPRLIAGIPSKLNLIAWNPVGGLPFEAPAPEAVEAFAEPVRRAGYTVVVRQSRGADIAAACGQLAGVLGEAGADG